jgi:hypothetical protein
MTLDPSAVARALRGSAAHACATRWIEAGREAFAVAPVSGSNLNDV